MNVLGPMVAPISPTNGSTTNNPVTLQLQVKREREREREREKGR